MPPIFYSIIVPVLNEGLNLPSLIERIDISIQKMQQPYEIIIINDRGKDGSWEILQSLKLQYPHLDPVERNSKPGMGLALCEGFKRSKGEIIITLDGDLSHDPAQIPMLINALDHFDMVCGSRYTKGGISELSVLRFIASRLSNWLLQRIKNIPIKDMTSNFRVIRRKVLTSTQYNSHYFGISLEILIKAHRQKFKITEHPIHYHPRQNGHSHMNLKQLLDYLKVIW